MKGKRYLPRKRVKHGPKRTRKIEVKLTPAEESEIRRKFGRKAASVARTYWLGVKPIPCRADDRPNPEMVRIMWQYWLQVEALRRNLPSEFRISLKDYFQIEDEAFNKLAQSCFSNFLKAAIKTSNRED